MKNSVQQFIITAGLLFLNATFNGTVLYICYPFIHYIFPMAIETGVLSPHPPWVACIAVSWLIAVLFKSSIKIENKITSSPSLFDLLKEKNKREENEEN